MLPSRAKLAPVLPNFFLTPCKVGFENVDFVHASGIFFGLT